MLLTTTMTLYQKCTITQPAIALQVLPGVSHNQKYFKVKFQCLIQDLTIAEKVTPIQGPIQQPIYNIVGNNSRHHQLGLDISLQPSQRRSYNVLDPELVGIGYTPGYDLVSLKCANLKFLHQLASASRHGYSSSQLLCLCCYIGLQCSLCRK